MIQVDGIKAHAETLEGQGETLLLLHGWGPSSVSASTCFRLEGSEVPLSGHDDRLSGHGDSGMPGKDWGIRNTRSGR